MRESVRWLVKHHRLTTPDDLLTLLPVESLPVLSVSFATRGVLFAAGLGGFLWGVIGGNTTLAWFALFTLTVAGASFVDAFD